MDDDAQKEFILQFRIFVTNHSSLFNLIWNVQSFQLPFDFISLALISTFYFCFPLINLVLFNEIVLSIRLLMYNLLPIPVNKVLILFF